MSFSLYPTPTRGRFAAPSLHGASLWAAVLALCGLAVVACAGEKAPREPAPAAPAAKPLAAPAASVPAAAAVSVPVSAPPIAVEPAPTPEELPLPEDFEAEAARQITAANFRKQLDAIEHEMNAPSSESPSAPAHPRGVQK
jgi:hypothetical protein